MLYCRTPPQAVLASTQQLPKPEAQLPATVPARAEHSDPVRQTPATPESVEHGSFGKLTMENKLWETKLSFEVGLAG